MDVDPKGQPIYDALSPRKRAASYALGGTEKTPSSDPASGDSLEVIPTSNYNGHQQLSVFPSDELGAESHPLHIVQLYHTIKGSSNSSLRRPSRVFARVPAIRPCLARSLPHLHGHMLTLRLHVPIQVRCRSRKALKNGRDRGKTHLGNLVDSTPPAGDLSRSSGGHGHERPATPGRPTVDPLCILDPLPAHF